MSQPGFEELLSCRLFDNVPVEMLAEVQLRPVQARFNAGALIFDREDASNDVYFLTSGRVLAVYLTEDGRELIYGRIGVGSYFGEMAALDGKARSLSVYAHRDSTILKISPASFLDLVDRVQPVRRRILQDLVDRIRQMNERNYQTTAFSVDQRVRAYLVRLGLEAGSLINGGEIADAPTHAEIASSVGSNREAVSRVMANLKREEVISGGRQKIKFLKPDALIEEAH